MGLIAAAIGLSVTFIVHVFFDEVQFNYLTYIVISVLLSASASVLLLYGWLTLITVT